jgi:hypothetical protein
MTTNRPKVSDHNTQTDEVIVREMTDEEFEQYKLDAAESKLEADRVDAHIAAKQSAIAKLAGLGLTAEEAAALLS